MTDLPKRLKPHTIYKLKDGKRVPGVTTVLGCLALGNKLNNLIKWGNRLGLEGINSEGYKDEMAIIGSLAHEFIMADLKGQQVDTSEYSKFQIDKAENCFLKYLEWRKSNDMEVIFVEQPLVSEAWGFGGMPDALGIIKKVVTLPDWKTGFIAKEHYVQACAYRQLAILNGFPAADEIKIMSFPRTEDEKFQEYTYTEFETGWQIFLSALTIYQLEKKIK